MKFSVDGTTLREAASLVDQAVSQKADVPEQSHVYIMVTGPGGGTQGNLFMCGYNGRYMVTVKNLAVADAVGGSVLINAQRWQRLMGECGGKAVEFESDGSTFANIKLIPKTGKPQKFNLNAMDASAYTGLGVVTPVVACVIDKWHMRDALRIVRPAADSNNSIELFNGVCFEFGASTVKVIASDATVLSFADVDVVYAGSAPTEKLIRVVPKSAMDLVDKMIHSYQGSDISIIIGDSMVTFKTDMVELTTALLAGGTAYLNWQRQIPTSIDGPTFDITAGNLLNSMSLAEIVNGGQPVSVDISLKDGNVTLDSEGIGGSHDNELNCSSVIGEAKFRLDSKLVRTALSCMDKETILQVSTINENRRVQVVPTLPNLTGNVFQLWGAKTRKKAGA